MPSAGMVRVALVVAAASALTASTVDACAPFESGPEEPSDGGALLDGSELVDAPDASRDGDAGASDAECPVGRGPEMVRVSDEPYCIDATEVTSSQYEAFLAAGAPHASLDTEVCGWVSGWAPSAPAASPSAPVRVHWCAAAAYCAWTGKRLCGRRPDGGLLASGEVKADKSEWTRACGGSAGFPYPWGTNVDGGTCATAAAELSDVKSHPTCQRDGIYDMIGNAAEWENNCARNASPAYDQCQARGGGFDGNPLRCDESQALQRGEERGIRCCADALR